MIHELLESEDSLKKLNTIAILVHMEKWEHADKYFEKLVCSNFMANCVVEREKVYSNFRSY